MKTLEDLANLHIRKPGCFNENIEVGSATILAIRVRSAQETMWVLPGGERTADRDRAHNAAMIIDKLIRARAA